MSKKGLKVIRLTKEQTLERAARNWVQFRDRLAQEGVTYEAYVKEVLKEWNKQRKMSDKQLSAYRDKTGIKIIQETRSTFSGESDRLDKAEEKYMKEKGHHPDSPMLG